MSKPAGSHSSVKKGIVVKSVENFLAALTKTRSEIASATSPLYIKERKGWFGRPKPGLSRAAAEQVVDARDELGLPPPHAIYGKFDQDRALKLKALAALTEGDILWLSSEDAELISAYLNN